VATEDSGQDPLDREDPRLTSLDERLAKVQRDEAARSGKKVEGKGKGYSQGNRVLSALIGGIAGGALIGWLLDRWLGTAPLLLLALMFLGIIVAFRNIIKISGERPD
jgi:ATP synthase protein I